MRSRVRARLVVAAAVLAGVCPWLAHPAGAAQRACTAADFTDTITDADTAIRYTFPVDNPTTCTEGGPGDTFIATYNGSSWNFARPASVQPGFVTVPANPTCTSIIEYSVRGTLEDLDEDSTGNHPKYWGLHGLAEDHGAGVVGNAVYQQLQAHEPAGSTSLYSDFYPADDLLSATNVGTLSTLYKASLTYGINQATSDLNLLRASCPNSRILIVGYSQGADVVRRTLTSSALSTAVGGPGVLVELFGDPNFSPHEHNLAGTTGYDPTRGTVLLNGAYTQPHSGLEHSFEPALIDNPPAFPARFTVESWCHDLEPVCQGDGASTDSHLDYGAQDGYAAGTAAAAFFATNSATGFPLIPAVGPVPTANSTFYACTSMVPGTTTVKISFGNAGSATSVDYYRTVGYSTPGAGTITMAPGTTSITTVAAHGVYTWTQNLPFIFGQSHFLYNVQANGVANPVAVTASGAHPDQIVYQGFYDTAC